MELSLSIPTKNTSYSTDLNYRILESLAEFDLPSHSGFQNFLLIEIRYYWNIYDRHNLQEN